MQKTATPLPNRLLAALSPVDRLRWEAKLEPVDMPQGMVLYESGVTLSHVYFPTNAIVSLLYVTADGHSSELAMVGNEGLVGINLFMGSMTTPNRAVVQCAGQGFRLHAHTIRSEFETYSAIAGLMLRYTQAMITQVGQTVACNRHHTLDKQLCRWLLMTLDRLQGQDIAMTQEAISNILGVRREGVTEAALKLQKAGLISYARGHIAVLDRPGIEARTCECYAVVKHEYDRLLPPVPTPQAVGTHAYLPRLGIFVSS